MASLVGHALHDVWHHHIWKPPFWSLQRKKMSQCFPKSPLSVSFSKTYIFGAQKHCTCVDGRQKQRKILCFKNIQIHVDRTWMITLPQGLAQVDQKHTLFCQQSLLGWNYQTIWIRSINASVWIHSNQSLIELILIPFQLQNLPIYTRNGLDAFCCVNGLSYSSHLLRN